jgi:hypothetical protein
MFDLKSVPIAGVIEPPAVTRLVPAGTRRLGAGVVAVDRQVPEKGEVRIRANDRVRG